MGRGTHTSIRLRRPIRTPNLTYKARELAQSAKTVRITKSAKQLKTDRKKPKRSIVPDAHRLPSLAHTFSRQLTNGIATRFADLFAHQLAKFPLSTPPNPKFLKGFENYEIGHDEKLKELERRELICYYKTCVKFAENHQLSEDKYFKVLDGEKLSASEKILQEIPGAIVSVSNPCAQKIAKGRVYKKLLRKYPGQIHLTNSTELENLQDLADLKAGGYELPTFSLIWFDLTGEVGDKEHQTIELYFQLGLFPKNRPSTFALTFSLRTSNNKQSASEKEKHRNGLREDARRYVEGIALGYGYLAFQPALLHLPTLKLKNTLVTWVFAVASLEWSSLDLGRLNRFTECINQTATDFRDTLKYDSGVHPLLRKDLYYTPNPVVLKQSKSNFEQCRDQEHSTDQDRDTDTELALFEDIAQDSGLIKVYRLDGRDMLHTNPLCPSIRMSNKLTGKKLEVSLTAKINKEQRCANCNK